MTSAPLLSAHLRVVVLLCHGVVLAGLPLAAGVPGVLLSLPLLAPLRGLWTGHAYTFAWCSMLLVFYVGACLMEATARPDHRAAALALASVSALEFCALMLYVRARSVEKRRAQAAAGAASPP